VSIMGFPGWAWNWGWGWAATVGAIILLGIFLLPWFFFLLNLQTTLNRVSDRNRAMPAGHVWLNFIPVFNLGWFIYTVTKVRNSVRDEYQTRGWAPEGDFGYNVGLATGILAIATFFMGWVPVVGWALGIAQLVCWIIYWLKTADLKNRLSAGERWQRPTPYPPPTYSPAPGYRAAPQATHPPPQSDPADRQPLTGDGDVKLCAGCGSAFDPGDKFCRTCGLPLP
jgi:hypothetical protein